MEACDWVVVFLVVVVVWFFLFCKETMATSPGTLIQLSAKGPQDYYLTGDDGACYSEGGCRIPLFNAVSYNSRKK